jgi:type IV pilus assembly protein PilY1
LPEAESALAIPSHEAIMKKFSLSGPTKLVAFLVLLPTGFNAFGASTTISDTPLPVTSSVPPNIMFVIDDSGSMSHIVVDSPYDAATTYLNCASPFPGGSATVLGARSSTYEYGFRVMKADGTTEVRVNDGSINYIAFNSGANTCFDSNLYYLVTSLNALGDPLGTYWRSNTTNGTSIYTGNYLNWFFCTGAAPNCNAAANFGAGAQRKPGTRTRLEVVKDSAKSVITGLGSVRVGLAAFSGESGGSLKVPVANLSAQTSAGRSERRLKRKSTTLPMPAGHL